MFSLRGSFVMKRAAAMIACLLLSPACSPPAMDASSAGEDETSEVTGLADCPDPSSEEGSQPGPIAPCRITLAGSDVFLRIASAAAPGAEDETSGALSIDVFSGQGERLQSLSEEVDHIAWPEVRDLDGDGLEDLLIPLMTGNVNTVYALHLQREGLGFVRAGELGGVSIERTDAGYISASGRSSAVEWETSYYRITANALEEVARVSTTPEYEDGEGQLQPETCTILSRQDEALTPEDLCPPRED